VKLKNNTPFIKIDFVWKNGDGMWEEQKGKWRSCVWKWKERGLGCTIKPIDCRISNKSKA